MIVKNLAIYSTYRKFTDIFLLVNSISSISVIHLFRITICYNSVLISILGTYSQRHIGKQIYKFLDGFKKDFNMSSIIYIVKLSVILKKLLIPYPVNNPFISIQK